MWVNAILRFLLELTALVAFAAAGWHATDGALRIVTAVAAIVVAASFWGLLVAPTARRRLRDPARLVVELVFFAASGIALASVTAVVAGAVFTAVAWANAALLRRLGEPAG